MGRLQSTSELVGASGESRPALRPYQAQAVENVKRAILAGNRRALMVLPTGGGKSIIFAEIIRMAVEKGSRVLWIVHRRNLVRQMQSTLEMFGVDSGVIMSGVESELEKKVQLCTVQTYSRRLDLDEDLFNRFCVSADMLMCDEAHTSVSPRYKKIFKKYPGKIIIGCTATPIRGDGRGLGEVYQGLVEVETVRGLTENGYLSPVQYYVAPEQPDLDGITVRLGDYAKGELGNRMNQPKLVGDVVENWLRVAEGRKTLVFAVSVKHSKALCEEFLANGIKAYHLDARSPDYERDYAFQQMQRGEISVITNVAVYQEGLDVPSISCVVMARPTKSIGLFRQCGGRGLRVEEGKSDLIFLDHGRVIDEHGTLDEEIEWSLDGRTKAWKKRKPREKEENLIECTVCHRVFSGQSKCPDCGSPVKSHGKKIETTADKLVRLNGKKKTTMADKRRFYGMLEAYRASKGFQPGWTAHKYRAKFGVWPRKMDGVAPIKPDLEFNNWMRYQFIKWKKSQEKREANGHR